MSSLASRIVDSNEEAADLAALVERAASGEEVVIGRSGRPVAKLVPYRVPEELPPRTGGDWKDKVVIRDDFDAPLPWEVLAAFEGRMP